MISKALKALPRKVALAEEKKNATAIGRFTQKLIYLLKMYLYYPVDSFISRTYERVSRSLAFAIHGYMHYDFESAYLYDIMAFKMKRILKSLNNGYAVQTKENMNALKEAITICDRLFKGNYDEKYYKAHAKKWGNLRSKHIPEYDDNGKIKYYRWETSRKNSNTPSKKKKEIADLRQIWVFEEQDRQKDLARLHEIFIKHEPTWWD